MPKKLTAFSRVSRNSLVAGATFALTLAIGLFVIGSMNHRFAQRQLQSEAMMILKGFHYTLSLTKRELAQLPPLSQLGCENGLSTYLARRTFDNGAIRWLGVADDGNIVCRSHVVGIGYSSTTEMGTHRHRMEPGWWLRSLPAPNEKRALFLVHDRFDVRYIAALQPPRMDYLSAFPCLDCREFQIRILSEPPLVMASPPLDSPTVLHAEVRRSDSGLPVAITLSANNDFLEHYRLQGWVASIVLVSLIAALITYLVLRLLRTRDSLDFLIREGLRKHTFVPYYQPIIDARDGQVLGAEALARWMRSDGSAIPPDQFIPYAEESGLIMPITDQITEIVVADAQRFGWAGTHRYVSINLVPEQLHINGYCDRLSRLIAARGIEPNNVAVEITERRQFKDLERGRQVLGKLVARGIEVKLDDAGTGFGGFSYVQELPISTLKIDKMFVDTLRNGGDAKRQVLDAIVHFAHTSGLQTIAEGVETPEQVTQLVAMGVFAIQGYVYAKPMKSDDFIAWMAAR